MLAEGAPLAVAAVPDAPLDDASPPEVTLVAVLHMHSAELLACAGQATEQYSRDGQIASWLLAGIERAVARLREALGEFDKEKRAHV